ncbi:hypothetical protein CJD_2778 [Clostridium perfringens D str. JGS1721]|uniref:Uncharacterized protein n=1 Tax=Clostridium perfringens D str. JGS1721 TaxID=488537 RepID=B1UYS5_CLOPF|nr:hypothetical protein CJD_2778 [Clostridium perfringens D str. JGS1721]
MPNNFCSKFLFYSRLHLLINYMKEVLEILNGSIKKILGGNY